MEVTPLQLVKRARTIRSEIQNFDAWFSTATHASSSSICAGSVAAEQRSAEGELHHHGRNNVSDQSHDAMSVARQRKVTEVRLRVQGVRAGLRYCMPHWICFYMLLCLRQHGISSLFTMAFPDSSVT